MDKIIVSTKINFGKSPKSAIIFRKPTKTVSNTYIISVNRSLSLAVNFLLIKYILNELFNYTAALKSANETKTSLAMLLFAISQLGSCHR